MAYHIWAEAITSLYISHGIETREIELNHAVVHTLKCKKRDTRMSPLGFRTVYITDF